ncbi:type 1 glutamine amidotransferase [Corynebacterium sp. sy017]|uniref:type 1 glutamine amidotransferase n=1 Tax=unclassified Corynebacterium TaxID=2624378 RepID=UPI001184C45E|nr:MULTISPECIES: type 1 glutamine amidotransferase [unclassified Corynebacterium]MBP3088492.1 type 1 glutamine amidotransferase [Corynebacterium sp. sy017]TSD91797.1 type 1 glutamine amidotransferase [Corynebacterium sp. SY003]
MITVMQPDPKVTLDRFQTWLQEAGQEIQLIALYEQPVPQLGECGEALLILGGTMDALDAQQSPWLPDLHRLLRQALAQNVPVMGICLGHQIIADCFGGEVVVNSHTHAEEGVREIVLTSAGQADPILGALDAKAHLPLSHHDAVTVLPAGATLLASSAACPLQSFRLGSITAVQFHPEASPRTAGYWASLSGGDETWYREEQEKYDADIQRNGKALAAAFAASVTVADNKNS